MHNQPALPITIDPFKLANASACLQGYLPLVKLSRLAKLLTDTKGYVDVTLNFGQEAYGGPYYIKGCISGQLHMICQRCGNALQYDINVEPKLSPVQTDDQAEHLPSDYEAWITKGELVLIADIVEEELLLNMPICAKHARDEQCSVTTFITD